VDIAESVCISIDCAPCIEITKAIGDGFALIGICGVGTITTSVLDGSGGIPTDESDVICTGCECIGAGMVHDGTTCAVIGICGGETITTTGTMAAQHGDGAGSGELACISIVCAPCIGIIRATGVVCAPIGICGAATITTDDLSGSGDVTVELEGICTDCAS